MIAAILERVPFRYSPLKSYWLIEQLGSSEIGLNTRLAGTPASTLEQGRSTFAYAADDWGSGLSAWEAIQALTASERGRFFVDREGVMRFQHRHTLLQRTTSSATFTDSMTGLDYTYGDTVANHVEVTLTPRSIGAPNSLLWQSSTPFQLDPGMPNARQFIVPYRDVNQRPLGAVSVIAPLRQTDFTANTHADGLGANLTHRVDAVLLQADVSSATLEFRNRSAVTVYIRNAQLRGQPIQRGTPLTVEVRDWNSINRYGLRTLRYNLPALTDPREADSLAAFELERRRAPRGTLREITLSSLNHSPQMLARTLYDRITIHEAHTNHQADYFIVAETHTLTQGGYQHTVRWLLEPTAANTFWHFDTARLNQTTILAY
jgi:hypothetical protein